MSTDKRALILRFCDEQQAIADKATKGRWTFNPYAAGEETDPAIVTDRPRFRGDIPPYAIWCNGPFWSNADGEFVAASRQLVPLLLGAIRAEASAHTYAIGGNGPWCHECDRYLASSDCPVISRIFASLGLEEKAE